jgi:spermidine synthase
MSTVRARVVPALFFASGFASLACEVAWFKWFGLAIGNTTQSASVVVTVFFVGLGLGSFLAGRAADRVTHPLRTYAALEATLAVLSFLTSTALYRWADWVPAFSPLMGVSGPSAVVVKLALAFVLLLPPTLLMGSTMPLLARFVVRHRAEVGAQVGTLYALNTLGAAVGCTFVGFVGIATLGVSGSAWLASAVYAAIGAAAFLASRSEEPEPRAEDPAPPRTEADALVLVAAFGASGFVSVGYEILWFRLLSLATMSTAYVFATLLAVYLIGLVIGAFVAARGPARTPDDTLRAFARAQLAVAVAGIVALALLGRARTFLIWWGGDMLSFEGVAAVTALVAVVLLPPSVLIGLTFPLASDLAVTRLSGLGARLGQVFAANTIIGAFGSLVIGMVLIPTIGSQGTAVALTLGNVLLFWAIVARFPEARPTWVRREGALTTAAAVAMHVWLGPRYLVDSQPVLDATVLDRRETADGTYLTVQYQEGSERYQQVIVNGTSYANNRPPGRLYMSLLAHLPILLHDDPREVVVICIGTGTTVGAASISDRVSHVSAVDLSPQIFAVAPYFSRWNHRFHEAKHVEKIVADGRHFLQVTPDVFDVLTFEPPPPIEAGVANLYSREFYQLARGKAREGALVVQWVPFQQGFLDLQRSMVRSMLDTFPHVSLWLADNQEGIVIGADRPLRLDPAVLAARMAEPDVRDELAEVGITDVQDLLALFVMADDDLAAWVGDVPAVTDDRPVVERFLGYPNTRLEVGSMLAHRTPIEAITTAPLPDADRYRIATEAWTAVWRAADQVIVGDYPAAARAVAPAAELVPTNAYFRYRRDELAREAAR